MNDLAARILQIRKARGLTQEELASKLGLTAQAVSKWETGAGSPDINILPQLAEALGVSLDVLFGRVPFLHMPVMEDMDSRFETDKRFGTASSEPQPEATQDASDTADSGQAQADQAANDTSEHESWASGEGPLKRLYQFGNKVLFSNIHIASTEGPLVTFVDGSTADLSWMRIKHRGNKGQIQIFTEDRIPPEYRRQLDEGTFSDQPLSEPFRHLVLDLCGQAEIEVMASPTAEPFWRYSGDEPISDAFVMEMRGETLTIRSLEEHFAWWNLVSGEYRKKRLLQIYLPLIEAMTLKADVSGVGTVKLMIPVEQAEVNVKGVGNVSILNARSARLNLGGAGNYSLERCAALDLRGSGASAVKIKALTGEAKVDLSGAAVVRVQEGMLNALDLRAAGTGQFKARKVKVGRLRVQLGGVSSCSLAAVEAIEKQTISRMAHLSIGAED